MIHIDLNETEGIAVVRPEEMVGLTQADFQQVTDRIDHYLKDHDTLRGLIIMVENFPGWENLSAFSSHVKLVRDHHKVINKVAIVSDSPLLTAAPHLVEHFVNAKVRHFAFPDIEEARTWMALDEAPSGRFVVLDGYPDNVVAVRAEGTITREDYEKTLIPTIEKKIGAEGRVKLLYWCGTEFKGFSAGAMWDDARFGVMHLGDILKIALVTDVEWLRMSTKFFAPVIPVPVQVFHNADIEDARRWIIES